MEMQRSSPTTKNSTKKLYELDKFHKPAINLIAINQETDIVPKRRMQSENLEAFKIFKEAPVK